MPVADIGGSVLVTRSEPGATQLVQALRQAGYSAVACQLLHIAPISSDALRATLAELDRVDIAIFVSGHAVQFGLDLIDSVWPVRPSLTWLAVGEATAAALARRGITAFAPERESSEGILALPQLDQVAGRRVLLCSGRDGRGLLANELVARGAEVIRLEVYRREPVPIETAAARLRGLGAIASVEISSAAAARVFASVWRAAGRDRELPVVVPSKRLATDLMALGFPRAIVADGAGAAAVTVALAQVPRISEGERHD